MKRALLCLTIFTGGVVGVVSPALSQTPAALTPDEALKLRWQRLLREADEAIADAQHKLDAAKQSVEVTARQAVLMTTGPNIAARAAALEAQKKAETDLAAAQKAKTDLLEKARVEGVPPGFLR